MAADSKRTSSNTYVPPWASLASGATSGLASCLLLQPMDLLKTRMQQEQRLADQHHSRGGPKKRTVRLVGLTRQVVQQDGLRGLWRGTVPTVARNVPGVALYFYSVNQDTASNKSTLARLTVTGNLLSGAVARVAVGFILSPITVVKARFESSHFSKESYPSLRRALVEIYQTGGSRGFLRGFSATALRDAPYAGLYLAIYEKAKDTFAFVQGDEDRGSSLVVSLSGLVAGTLATLLTHPFDILKTRIQTLPEESLLASPSASSGASVTTARQAPSIVAMTRHILQHDGAGAFLDGLGLRCARKAASSAIGWTIFEGGRGIWVRRQSRLADTDASVVQ